MKNNNGYYQTAKDLTNNPKDNLRKQLKQLIPEVFLDGELDFNLLKKCLEDTEIIPQSNQEIFFGLYWKGKTQAKNNAFNNTNNVTLKPNKNKSLNFDTANNIVIEGDNLKVLKTLQIAYHNQVNVIYIDPPYNTGSDFTYNDDFKDSSTEYKLNNSLIDENGLKKSTNQKTNGRFHTNWLNMIYPRLLLARNLLKKDGIIFISIDDNEQARLKLICDEIFGEENFVTTITWVKKHGPGGNTSFNYKIINNTEYILCYAKNIDHMKFNYIIHDHNKLKELGYTNKDKYFDERGYYKLTHLFHPSSTGSFQYTESLDYPIMAPDGTQFKLHCNKNGKKLGRYTWSYETYLVGNQLGFIECKKNSDGDWVAFRKQYQYVKFDVKNKKIIKIDAGQPYENLIDDFYSQEGGNEIKQIFNDKNVFDFPKPKNLIIYLLKMVSQKDSLILDFFAGSGTTAQAVMELNKEDGGNRKYILVQLPEIIENNSEFKTICDITTARIKRSIDKYDYKDKGFKYFKLTDSHFKTWKLFSNSKNEEFHQQLNLYEDESTKQSQPEDILYELLLKIGLPLDSKIIVNTFNNYQYWTDEFHEYLFLLGKLQNIDETTIINNFVEIIKTTTQKNKNDSQIRIFILESYFQMKNGDQLKINLCEQIKIFYPKHKIFIV